MTTSVTASVIGTRRCHSLVLVVAAFEVVAVSVVTTTIVGVLPGETVGLGVWSDVLDVSSAEVLSAEVLVDKERLELCVVLALTDELELG